MKLRLVIRRPAQQEIDEQTAYLAERSEAVAERFLAAVRESVEELLEMPGMGARWLSPKARLQGIRRRKVKGFPNYLLFYQARGRTLEILHLFHGAQDVESRLGAE